MRLIELTGEDPNEFIIQVAIKRSNGSMACKSYFFHEGEWHYQLDVVAPREEGFESPITYAGSKTLGHPSVAAQEAIMSLVEAFSCVVDKDELPVFITEYKKVSEHGDN